MNVGERLERLVRRHEGLKLKPYLCPAQRLTIGVGRKLEDTGIPEEEALYLLRNDLGRVRRDLDRLLPLWRRLDEVRQAVLVSMAFQLDTGGLLGFGRALAALEGSRCAAPACSWSPCGRRPPPPEPPAPGWLLTAWQYVTH